MLLLGVAVSILVSCVVVLNATASSGKVIVHNVNKDDDDERGEGELAVPIRRAPRPPPHARDGENERWEAVAGQRAAIHCPIVHINVVRRLGQKAVGERAAVHELYNRGEGLLR